MATLLGFLTNAAGPCALFALGVILSRRKIEGMLDAVLDGLATHLERGVLIGANGVPQSAPMDAARSKNRASSCSR